MDVIPVLRFFKNTEALSKKQATAEEVAEETEEEVYSTEHSRPSFAHSGPPSLFHNLLYPSGCFFLLFLSSLTHMLSSSRSVQYPALHPADMQPPSPPTYDCPSRMFHAPHLPLPHPLPHPC